MDLEKEIAALDRAKVALRILHWLSSVSCFESNLLCDANHPTATFGGEVNDALCRAVSRPPIRDIIFDTMRKQANADVLEAFAVLAQYANEARGPGVP